MKLPKGWEQVEMKGKLREDFHSCYDLQGEIEVCQFPSDRLAAVVLNLSDAQYVLCLEHAKRLAVVMTDAAKMAKSIQDQLGQPRCVIHKS